MSQCKNKNFSRKMSLFSKKDTDNAIPTIVSAIKAEKLIAKLSPSGNQA